MKTQEAIMLFEGNIQEAARKNTDFRRVVATGPHSQLVTMSIPPTEDIGAEVHPGTDQILFIVAGAGKAFVDKESIAVKENDVVFVPAGAKHNLVNTGRNDLRLFTVYAPPNHKDGTVHHRKADALADEHEHEPVAH
jgi:mannose-6-phosphate isomerase-like protein (cupin superfamily)